MELKNGPFSYLASPLSAVSVCNYLEVVCQPLKISTLTFDQPVANINPIMLNSPGPIALARDVAETGIGLRLAEVQNQLVRMVW